MCKNISTWERSSFLNLQMTAQFQAYTIFSVPKIIPINTLDTRKPLFFPTGFSERLIFDFLSSVKSYEGGTSFSSQTTFFNAEISYEIKGVRFDRMKISGRRWFSTVNKNPHQFHMIKSNKEVTRKTRETYFLHRKPQKLKIWKKYHFSKIVFEKNEKFHSLSRIVPKIRKLANYRRNTKMNVFPSNCQNWAKRNRSFLFFELLSVFIVH